MGVTWLHIFVGMFAYFLVFVFIPACFGFEMGGRRLYIFVLLRLFRWGKKIKESPVSSERQPDSGATASPEDQHGSGNFKLVHQDSSKLPRNRSFNTFQREFHLSDVCEFATSAIEAITDDEVTKGFSAEQLSGWNLLWRNKGYYFISWRLTLVYWLGVMIRYCLLLPMRLICFSSGILWLVLTMAVFSVLPNFKNRRMVENWATLVAYRLVGRALTAHIRFHNKENAARPGGVCVANHTSPIDCAVLSVDGSFSLVGQRQGGVLGIVQKALSMAQNHVWFERSVASDRSNVIRRLSEHLSDRRNNPILIFPEGTCINNTKVYMFKKGSFDLNAPFYPVAIKYDPRFADPFWNSSQQSMETYLWRLLTSWALVVDVYYLEPTTREDNENALEFASRVKTSICEKGGLVDVVWDGNVKRELSHQVLKQKQVEWQETTAFRFGLNTNDWDST